MTDINGQGIRDPADFSARPNSLTDSRPIHQIILLLSPSSQFATALFRRYTS
jgi:hypothetical protein